jgi:hypothetical protein
MREAHPYFLLCTFKNLGIGTTNNIHKFSISICHLISLLQFDSHITHAFEEEHELFHNRESKYLLKE